VARSEAVGASNGRRGSCGGACPAAVSRRRGDGPRAGDQRGCHACGRTPGARGLRAASVGTERRRLLRKYARQRAGEFRYLHPVLLTNQSYGPGDRPGCDDPDAAGGSRPGERLQRVRAGRGGREPLCPAVHRLSAGRLQLWRRGGHVRHLLQRDRADLGRRGPARSGGGRRRRRRHGCGGDRSGHRGGSGDALRRNICVRHRVPEPRSRTQHGVNHDGLRGGRRAPERGGSLFGRGERSRRMAHAQSRVTRFDTETRRPGPGPTADHAYRATDCDDDGGEVHPHPRQSGDHRRGREVLFQGQRLGYGQRGLHRRDQHGRELLQQDPVLDEPEHDQSAVADRSTAGATAGRLWLGPTAACRPAESTSSTRP